jgi:hypothetical protein
MNHKRIIAAITAQPIAAWRGSSENPRGAAADRLRKSPTPNDIPGRTSPSSTLGPPIQIIVPNLPNEIPGRIGPIRGPDNQKRIASIGSPVVFSTTRIISLKTFSLLGAVKFFGELSRMEHVRHSALEEAAQMIEDRAKELIGHQQSSWPPLKPETVAHKATGDSPLLETGEMRDSISHMVDGHEAGDRLGSR